MLSLLAQTMRIATRTDRDPGYPDHLKEHADRYVPRDSNRARHALPVIRTLW